MLWLPCLIHDPHQSLMHSDSLTHTGRMGIITMISSHHHPYSNSSNPRCCCVNLRDRASVKKWISKWIPQTSNAEHSRMFQRLPRRVYRSHWFVNYYERELGREEGGFCVMECDWTSPSFELHDMTRYKMGCRVWATLNITKRSIES